MKIAIERLQSIDYHVPIKSYENLPETLLNLPYDIQN